MSFDEHFGPVRMEKRIEYDADYEKVLIRFFIIWALAISRDVWWLGRFIRKIFFLISYTVEDVEWDYWDEWKISGPIELPKVASTFYKSDLY